MSACDAGSESRSAGTWEQLSPERDQPIQAVPLELGCSCDFSHLSPTVVPCSSLPPLPPTAAFLLCQGPCRICEEKGTKRTGVEVVVWEEPGHLGWFLASCQEKELWSENHAWDPHVVPVSAGIQAWVPPRRLRFPCKIQVIRQPMVMTKWGSG